ncbi:hypothetical protein [Methylocystis rosea]|uniref:hypothetical protein n=1 Tax=Methylocystis rosea TaxID=173366 RepID=UPI00036B07BC|nr:hypothetical protein [Methylocystis rosea]
MEGVAPAARLDASPATVEARHDASSTLAALEHAHRDGAAFNFLREIAWMRIVGARSRVR